MSDQGGCSEEDLLLKALTIGAAVLLATASAAAAEPRYYPDAAQRISLEGRAVISCTVTAEGLVENCEVISEDPPGFGFGAAALRLSASFRMRPQTIDGVPVGGAKVTVPLAFRLPQNTLGDGASLPGAGVGWARRPSQAQLDAMRPPGVSNTASVSLQCWIIAKGADAGALRDCSVEPIYDPTGDLGRAAIALAPQFRLTAQTAAKAKPGAQIKIPLHWSLGPKP